MLAVLSYTQKVWTVGFRSLIKQMNFYQSWPCVEMPSVMALWHIHVQIHESTIHRSYVECVVLMEAMFPCINLKFDDWNLHATILVHKLSQLHKLLILILILGKLIGISLIEMGLMFSKIHPGAMSDFNITEEKFNVISWV